MKKVKMLLLSLLIVIVLFAGGCTASPDLVNAPDASGPETTDTGTSNSQEPTVTETNEIRVSYATDELLSKYKFFHEFVEFEDEGCQKIVISANVAVTDFKFIEIGYQEENGSVSFAENEVLYAMDELTPEKPFVVTWMESGAIPNRGISFVDKNSMTRYFYIAKSGEDNSLFLTEFK